MGELFIRGGDYADNIIPDAAKTHQAYYLSTIR